MLGGEGSPGIILGLPVLLWHTGILCHRGAGGEGSPGIILGLPVLFRHTGILSHRGAGGGGGGGEGSPGIIPGMPVLLWCSRILAGWTSLNLSRDYPRTALVTLPCVRYLVLYMAPLDMCEKVHVE